MPVHGRRSRRFSARYARLYRATLCKSTYLFGVQFLKGWKCTPKAHTPVGTRARARTFGQDNTTYIPYFAFLIPGILNNCMA